MKKPVQNRLLTIYEILLCEQGFRHWWPSESPFETIIGAILTQNVAWVNAERAIKNLRNNDLLEPLKLYDTDIETISQLIVSSRFYNQKAKKIKNFVTFFIDNYNADLELMKNEDLITIKTELINIKGLGEETVDSILLYALNKPIFVIDAYTMRIFKRYGFLHNEKKYSEIQKFFMNNLPEDVSLFNDFHAQIVYLGNSICKKDPLCIKCPIKKINENFGCNYCVKPNSSMI